MRDYPIPQITSYIGDRSGAGDTVIAKIEIWRCCPFQPCTWLCGLQKYTEELRPAIDAAGQAKQCQFESSFNFTCEVITTSAAML
jgi:hypothetical protein